MNLQAGGVLLIAVVATIYFLTYRRRTDAAAARPAAASWGRALFRRFETSSDDPVDRAANTIVGNAKVFNRVLYAPLHVSFQCDATTRDFMMANPAGTHSQVVARTNELGENEANRRGVKWNPIKGLTMNYPIAVGPEDVKVSFTPFEGSPFTADSAPDELPAWNSEPQPDGVFGGAAVPWATGTIPPPRRTPRPPRSVVVTAAVAGGAPRDAVVALSNGPTNLQIGRDAASGIVLPALPGISARHLLLTFDAGGRYVTDMSTHGTWIESTSGWTKLPSGTRTQLPSGARLLLDADQRVVVSVSEGEAQ